MLAKATDTVYHRHMQKYVRLKSGIEVPERTFSTYAKEIYENFSLSNSWFPDMLSRLSFLADHNFPKSLVDELIGQDDIRKLQGSLHNYRLRPLWPRCQGGMAKTAIAASMVVAEEVDGYFSGYIQEPIESQEIIPELYQTYLDKHKVHTNSSLLF